MAVIINFHRIGFEEFRQSQSLSPDQQYRPPLNIQSISVMLTQLVSSQKICKGPRHPEMTYPTEREKERHLQKYLFKGYMFIPRRVYFQQKNSILCEFES